MEPEEKLRLDTYSKIKTQINDLLVNSTPENHRLFFEKFSITNECRSEFVKYVLSSFADTTVRLLRKETRPPKIIHRIWLTQPENPNTPPESYLKRITQQTHRLSDDYEYVFWHNSDVIASELGTTFAGTNMEFRDIKSIAGNEEIQDRILRAISMRKFVLAGDISKYLIIKEYGGIYADLGVDFDEPLLDLVNCGGISLFLDQNLFFQPAFMAAPANSNPFKVWCDLISQPEIFSAIALTERPKFSYGNEIWLNGGVGFTASLILFYDNSYNILPVPPNRGLLHHESQGSWYKPGNKFGNAAVDSAIVSHLNWETHSNYIYKNKIFYEALSESDPAHRIRMNILWHLRKIYWFK